MAISVFFGGTTGSHSRNPEVPRNSSWKTLLYGNVYLVWRSKIALHDLLWILLPAVSHLSTPPEFRRAVVGAKLFITSLAENSIWSLNLYKVLKKGLNQNLTAQAFSWCFAGVRTLPSREISVFSLENIYNRNKELHCKKETELHCI